MRLSLDQITFALTVAVVRAAIELPASAQYITNTQQARQAVHEQIEEEHAFYRELEGKAFWNQPGWSMRVRFYPTYKTFSSGEIYLPVEGAWIPSTKAYNDKFLTRSPKVILAQDVERNRFEAENAKKNRQERAEKDDARQLRLQEMVTT